MGVLSICTQGFVVSRCRCREVHDPVDVLMHADIEHGHVDRLAGWQYVIAHDGHLEGRCRRCFVTFKAVHFPGGGDLCEYCVIKLTELLGTQSPEDALADWQAGGSGDPATSMMNEVPAVLVDLVADAIADHALQVMDHIDPRIYARIAVERVLDWQRGVGGGP